MHKASNIYDIDSAYFTKNPSAARLLSGMNTFIHRVQVSRSHGCRLFPKAQSKHSNVVLGLAALFS